MKPFPDFEGAPCVCVDRRALLALDSQVCARVCVRARARLFVCVCGPMAAAVKDEDACEGSQPMPPRVSPGVFHTFVHTLTSPSMFPVHLCSPCHMRVGVLLSGH